MLIELPYRPGRNWLDRVGISHKRRNVSLNNKGRVARRATKQVKFPRRGNNDKEGDIGHGCDLSILHNRIGGYRVRHGYHSKLAQ